MRRGYSSAGLSRPDFVDVSRALKAADISPRTRAVVLYFGGNDAQALWLRPRERRAVLEPWVTWQDERWSRLYMRRARRLIDALCTRGVRSVVVLGPVDVQRTPLQERLERIRALQRAAVRSTRCGHFVATGAPRSAATRDVPEALYYDDGVHMTRRGAQLVWARIRARVMRLASR